MSGIKRELRIKKAVEDKLWSILAKRSPESKAPPKEDLQAISLAIKYLAVSAKLGEADWGRDLQGLTDPDDVKDPGDDVKVEDPANGLDELDRIIEGGDDFDDGS